MTAFLILDFGKIGAFSAAFSVGIAVEGVVEASVGGVIEAVVEGMAALVSVDVVICGSSLGIVSEVFSSMVVSLSASAFVGCR